MTNLNNYLKLVTIVTRMSINSAEGENLNGPKAPFFTLESSGASYKLFDNKQNELQQ